MRRKTLGVLWGSRFELRRTFQATSAFTCVLKTDDRKTNCGETIRLSTYRFPVFPWYKLRDESPANTNLC